MKFTELDTKAKIVAVKEFIVDYEDFFRDEGDPKLEFHEVYRILLEENDEHDYDIDGIVKGGQY